MERKEFIITCPICKGNKTVITGYAKHLLKEMNFEAEMEQYKKSIEYQNMPFEEKAGMLDWLNNLYQRNSPTLLIILKKIINYENAEENCQHCNAKGETLTEKGKEIKMMMQIYKETLNFI